MMESFTKFVLLAFVAFVLWGNSQAADPASTGSPAPTVPVTVSAAPTTPPTKAPSADTTAVPTTTKGANPTTNAAATAAPSNNSTTAGNATLTTPHGGSPSLIRAWGQLVALVPALLLLSA